MDGRTGRMQKSVALVSLLLLGWTWTIEGLPRLPTQENFNLQERAKRDVAPTFAADIESSGDDAPLFNGSEACGASMDTGPCLGSMQRYYYNSSSMSCQPFTYGGCLGNRNNFETERECLQRCRTEAVCRLPLAPITCNGHPLIWVFDSINGLCLPYKPNYCQDNGNKFYSKAECEEYCGVVKNEPELLS